jgi:chloride channel protein, CIC family
MRQTGLKTQGIPKKLLRHSLLRKYAPMVHEDLTATYLRDLHKWLIISPIIGVATGLTVTAIAVIILNGVWPTVLGYYFHHHWAIIPGLLAGFIVTGLIMQHLTPDPDEHSTEEVIRSYHERQGRINIRCSFAKVMAAITTVGTGGSAALEGPGIYSGGAIGSWLWTRMRRLDLDARDRRIMLICGAAAGMSAVFRAPLTGIVFALEMPYKDDLAHEALVPSLIASVISYSTMAAFLGRAPLFNFVGTSSYTGKDLIWCGLLGLLIGLVAMAFVICFRRVRGFVVRSSVPHWVKLAIGGLLTGVCGVLFLQLFPGTVIPLGPNYEAAEMILRTHHTTVELIAFGVFKLAATTFTLGFGGVSAMFVPLFLTGGSFGVAFAQSVVHSASLELYAAVGMAAFIAAGYKTPLAAVVFVAEATGGHAFIIPALIGAAVAYVVSGDASASGDQRLHGRGAAQKTENATVDEVMQQPLIYVQASLSLREFTEVLAPHRRRMAFAVFDGNHLIGTVALWSLAQVPPEEWAATTVRDITEKQVTTVRSDCEVIEASRLFTGGCEQDLVLVVSPSETPIGLLTKGDILSALNPRPEDTPELDGQLWAES